jgi:uncharacterized protein (DUF1697 family)
MSAKPKGGEGRPVRAGKAYVALLRGINVGGRSAMAMEDLGAVFTALDFESVRTVLASGNVVFEAGKGQNAPEIVGRIESRLKKAFDLDVEVILRPMSAVRKLVAASPFAAERHTPDARFYVTFLRDALESARSYAYESIERDIRIFGLSAGEVGSKVVLSEKRGTTDLMRLLEKRFGPAITTRNWSTVEKIASSKRERPAEAKPRVRKRR